jgi:hypothetical protein
MEEGPQAVPDAAQVPLTFLQHFDRSASVVVLPFEQRQRQLP